MTKEKSDKQHDLAMTIIDKCEVLGCKGPNDTAELIGGATLFILSTMGDYLGIPFDEMRKEYVRGLLNAELV